MGRGKRVFLWVGLSSALVCCLGLTIPLWLALNGGDNLDRVLADYRRHGLPWTAGEVVLTPAPAKADNAADLLNRANAKFKGQPVTTDASDAWSLMTSGSFADADKLISKYEPSIELAKEAAHRHYAIFQKDWDLGPMVLFPELSTSKSLVKLLTVRGAIEAKRGQVDSSLSDLRDAWVISKFMGQSPSIVGMLVEIACKSITLAAIEQVITLFRENPQALNLLKSQLDGMTDNFNFQNTIRGEAYMGLVILRNGSLFRSSLISGSDDGSGTQPPIDPRRIRRTGSPNGLIERFAGGKVIKAYIELDDIAKRDGEDAVRLGSDLKEFDNRIEADDSLTAKYRDLLLPSYSNIGQVMVENKAKLLIAQALVQAMLQRARTGHFPTKISDIAGVWVDPFGGKPLRLKVKGNSIRIYSLGPNLKDDGGQARFETKGSDDYDIVAGSPPVQKSTAKTARP